jgi:hypothetical protein
LKRDLLQIIWFQEGKDEKCMSGLYYRVVTPVMMREKVKKFLKSKGINAEIKQYRVAEVSLKMKKPDVIVSTTTMPRSWRAFQSDQWAASSDRSGRGGSIR